MGRYDDCCLEGRRPVLRFKFKWSLEVAEQIPNSATLLRVRRSRGRERLGEDAEDSSPEGSPKVLARAVCFRGDSGG